MRSVFVNRNRKIVITIIVMLLLISLSCLISLHISKIEERSCWEDLQRSVNQISIEMESNIHSDRELLDSIADIILTKDSLDSPDVKEIIDGFKPNTMISHIALLLPGDKVMLPNEPIRDTGGVLSFEEEAALGRHTSGRSTDIRDESKMILRNFVPIIKDGDTIAMIYGVIELENLPVRIQSSAYSGDAAIYIIDRNNGDFILDTWHEGVGNISDLGDRETKAGYSHDQILQDVFDGKAGHCIFVSKTIGQYLYFYYEPTSINEWMIGISVPENTAFADVKKINKLLIGFIAVEITLLAGYFIYILLSTRKELCEKQKLAERDLLTGLLNRNCFERSISGYAESCKTSLTCVYFDVNGLHELNNTKGRAAGDEMLKTVADAIHKHFDDRDVFRIGGDEFMVFVKDENAQIIERHISDINDYLTQHEYNVSVGVFSQNVPFDIDEVQKQAEKNMYEAKKRYYEEKGIDRRKRS